MNLATEYLGLKLPHPLIAGASPLVDNLDKVRRLEDAGIAAIVMHSLFEEQIQHHRMGLQRYVAAHEESFAEARSYLPPVVDFNLGPDTYLQQLRKIKKAVAVPVIASLNGIHEGTWVDYARLMQQAGADALELNLYSTPRLSEETATEIEQRYLNIVRRVCAAVSVPVAVKLSPYFTHLAAFVRQLEAAGTKAVVLFNRFYQPDFDIEALEVSPRLHLSDSGELLARLRWTAMLYGRTKLEMSISGGVHTPTDVIKALMAGATTVQTVSALLKNGPQFAAQLREGLVRWLTDHEYDGLGQLRGSLSLQHAPDPEAIERAQYLKLLQSWRS